MEDILIYAKGDVTITKSVVRIGAKTFPVTDVKEVATRPAYTALRMFCLGSLGFVGGYGATQSGNEVSAFLGVVFLILGLIVVVSALRQPGMFRVPNWYVLRLRTFGGGQYGFTFFEKGLVHEAETAIEQAVALRGTE